MSKRNEIRSELPTYEEMQAAMRAARRLRSEAFAEFFGFGVVEEKSTPKPASTAASRPLAVGAKLAHCA